MAGGGHRAVRPNRPPPQGGMGPRSRVWSFVGTLLTDGLVARGTWVLAGGDAGVRWLGLLSIGGGRVAC